jgi:hypothetical protein
MGNSSRRGFLQAAGVGAAVVGVGAIAPSATAASNDVALPAGATGGLLAHVSDVRGDTVVLHVGDREVVVRDADLVARLARAAQ